MTVTHVRPLRDLLSSDPAWPLVLEWQRQATNRVEVLSVDRDRAEAALTALGVTTRSPLGAVVWESGGILVDGGWVRVLGSGCVRLTADVARWNGLGEHAVRAPLAGALIVALDAVGGVFALDGGAFGRAGHDVHYFGPDTLRWESLDCGYSGFLRFLFAGDLARFYERTRWRDWETDVATLSPNAGFSIYPPPWTAEGADLERAARKAVPMAELVEFMFATAASLTR